MPCSQPAPCLFVSAGEVSGDIYAAGLLECLKQLRPHLRAYGLGGPMLQAAGLRLLADVRALAAVGLSENLPGLPQFWQLKQRLTAWLRQIRPDAVVLVDFQGFNLQLAEVAKTLGIPVIYFIAPQDWLWGVKAGLARILARVDLVLAVFRPEAAYYRTAGARVVHVGHPLLDLLPSLSREQARARLDPHQNLDPDQPLICWMPGSRKTEVRRLLPVMAEVHHHLPRDWNHLLPLAADYLDGPLLRALPVRRVDVSDRYEAMIAADLVIGACGSMVLEAALLGRPVLALYRVSALTFAVARHVVKLPWISLPNLLLERSLVPEFVQSLPAPEIARQLHIEIRQAPKWALAAAELRGLLGPNGANVRAAQAILEFLEHK
ncbi:MAG: lipid-A-disaccharide synthase [Candidatus Melainabacteria bacterium HGW-Melainabacteria-1]|nr:MAG: lipid-A-disaccharide synthase [Candidatus Melainabacteria bacterium HGW-Melainabacteria-1]